MTEADTKSATTYFRWRGKSGAWTPWKPVTAGFVRVPEQVEGVEFHEGEPPALPRRRPEIVEST